MEHTQPPAEEGGHAGKEHGKGHDKGQDGEPSRTKRHQTLEAQARHDKILWRLLVAAIFLVPLLMLALELRLSGPRYVGEQLKSMWNLLGEKAFLIWHVAGYFSVAVGPFLLRRYGKHRERALEVLTLILVLSVLFTSTWNIASTTRSVVAQRAEKMGNDTVTAVNSQLSESSRSTCDLVILDQGIAKLMSYIHVIVRSEFPEFNLRTASLHMVPSGIHKEQVWNVIQEGSLRKDAEFLDYPEPNLDHTSLVGMTIKEGKMRYCPNINKRQLPDCETFQSPPSADTAFKSLVCFPLKTSLSSKVFASICFDSKLEDAFDNKTDELKDRIDGQMNQLSQLLQLYRNQDDHIFSDSQPAAQPPAAAQHPQRPPEIKKRRGRR